MHTKTAIKVILTIIASAAILSACSPVDRIIKAEKVFALSFVNDRGTFTVVDVTTGKVVPPCSRRPTEDFKACKFPNGFEYSPDKNKSKHAAKPAKSEVQIIDVHKIRITDWHGSHCRTFENLITGEVTEVCNPFIAHK